MRKILFPILLASTVATPAFAQFRPADRAAAQQERQAERAQAREDRSQAREERVQVREERPQAREERVQERARSAYQAPQPDARVREQVVRQQFVGERPANVNERGRPTLEQRQNAQDSVANWRRDQREAIQQQQMQRRDAVQQQVQRREVMEQQINQRDAVRQQRQERRADVLQQRQEARDRWVDAARSGRRLAPPAGARPDRPAPPPATAYNNVQTPQWHTDWRNHHDWRNYRRHHRSIFHLGFYYDPFGWGYQRYNIGWRLWPSYYNSSFWLDEPSMYALPYAPWPYRWVRYYDDALLVNVFSGQVVDVMYDFFW